MENKKLSADRQRLTDLMAERGTDPANTSRAIGRSHSYLWKFLTQQTPKRLSEEVRELLGRHFHVDPDMFRPGPYHPRPQAAAHAPEPQPQPPQFTADDLLENALDLVERAIQRHHTPMPPSMIAYLVKGICNLAISGNLESEETQTGAHLNKFPTTSRSK
jgi:hypothetical protein